MLARSGAVSGNQLPWVSTGVNYHGFRWNSDFGVKRAVNPRKTVLEATSGVLNMLARSGAVSSCSRANGDRAGPCPVVIFRALDGPITNRIFRVLNGPVPECSVLR